MPRPTFSTATTLLVVGVLAASVWFVRLFTVPLFGDEMHFVPATLALTPFRPGLLRSFSELSSPTFFIAFSYVAQLLGPRVEWFRGLIFACLCASLYLYRRLAARTGTEAGAWALAPDLSLILLLTFPYLLLCGVFYYTDVPALLCGLLAYQAFERRRSWRAMAWAAFAIHCRQFMVFVPVGMACVELWRTRHTPSSWSRAALMWSIPLISYLPYVVLWRDVSPMRTLYPQLVALPTVNPTHLSYLLAASGFYLAPVSGWLAWRRWPWVKIAVVGLAALWIVLSPPVPNRYFALIGSPITTLGLVDSTLTRLASPVLRTALLAGGAAVATALQFELLIRTPRSALTLRALILAFWVMNAFSHLTWDKYLLPGLPFIYLAALTHPSVAYSSTSRTS